MESIVILLVASVVGGCGAMIATSLRKQKQRRLAELSAIACGVCGATGVEERGPGSYRCSACGYDTDVEVTSARAAAIKQTQDVAIAIVCLENAIKEIDASRYMRSSGSDPADNGPFYSRYLEGMEQTEEALRLLMPVADTLPALEDAIAPLEQLPAPPLGRTAFNNAADVAIAHISAALPVIRTGHVTMVSRLKSD